MRSEIFKCDDTENWENQIELFLNTQRPRMQEWLEHRITRAILHRAEIKKEVRTEKKSRKNRLCIFHKIRRQ